MCVEALRLSLAIATTLKWSCVNPRTSIRPLYDDVCLDALRLRSRITASKF